MLDFLYNIINFNSMVFCLLILVPLRIFAPNLTDGLVDHLVRLKLWILSLCYSVVLTSFGYLYAVRFLVIATIRFMFRPRMEFFIPKVRNKNPAILRNERYGVHRWVDLDNISLHFVESGVPRGPLLIFLHGVFDFWFSWRRQVEEFSKNYRVILLDLRGFGQSEKPENWTAYSVNIVAEDIRRLVRQLGHHNVSLVGHGWGSVVGWAFLAQNPDMVNRYVFMTTPALDIIRYELFHNMPYLFASWHMLFCQTRNVPEWSVKLNDFEYLEQTVCQFANEEEREAYKYTFQQPMALRSSVNYYRTLSKVFEDGLPVTQGESRGLFLLAGNDPIKSSNCADYIRHIYPNVRVEEMAGVGHYLHLERPDLVNRRIRRFLDNPWDE